ncbi:MAG: hypothetical protein HYS05_09685 [Acidobacteria bacterium]|nr:hypothetical protein [Acidobacteriota bacterium]
MPPEPVLTRSPARSREDIAKAEIGHTDVSAALARATTATFLSLVCVVPLAQSAYDRWTSTSLEPTARSATARVPEPTTSMLVARYLANREAARADAPGFVGQVLALNRTLLEWITRFEEYLDDASLLGRTVRPPGQYVLTRAFGVGNEQAYTAREGWLFFRPDVDYLTGPGFLAPAEMKRRRAIASEWTTPPESDPRPAILDFQRQLRARGIVLVVVPAPIKPMVHPEKMARVYDGWRKPVNNPSYDELVANLRQNGVPVFDLSQALVDERLRSGRPQYLTTDTHWRPEAMERAARDLAAFVDERVPLPPAPDPGYALARVEVTTLGDIARMLDLPDDQTLLRPETVSIGRILSADGGPWRPQRSADVLVLGDSFSNIYSLGSMEWGDSAGFVEHLSHALRRPIDRIVQNADGAWSTRMQLRQELARGVDRLRGKRVVIFQVAARELASGDWKVIDLPAGQ